MATTGRNDPLLSPTSNLESASPKPSRVDVPGLLNSPSLQNGKGPSYEGSPSSLDQSEEQLSPNGDLSYRKKKLRQFASRTREATKRMLSTSDRQGGPQDLPQENAPSLRSLEDDAAFNVQRLDTKHQSDKGTAAKMKLNVQAVAAGILNPKQGIKGKATRSTASRLSKIERPYLSRDMDRDLLQAHDDLSREQSMSSTARYTSEDGHDLWNDDHKERIERLEAQRESLRAAYTSSRLVRRVRVVPKRHIDFSRNECFVGRNSREERVGYNWLKWLGYVRAIS